MIKYKKSDYEFYFSYSYSLAINKSKEIYSILLSIFNVTNCIINTYKYNNYLLHHEYKLQVMLTLIFFKYSFQTKI